MSNNASTQKSTAKPIFRKQLPGGISSAVFENTRDGRTYRSVNIQRAYKQNNDWKRMSLYLDHEHIPFMLEALQATWNYLNNTPLSYVENTDAGANEAELSSECEPA